MIKIRSLYKSFPSHGGAKTILDGVSFDCEQGTFTTIFGPNGCGKTTLVNIIAGLDKSFDGSFEGQILNKFEIGYVFQDYRRSLLPWHSVRENILYPLRLQSVSRQIENSRLEELLDKTGIKVDLKQRVYSLSGGQAQAVCILRALIVNPKLLILDEPFAALDYERTIALRTLVSSISKDLKLTVLFISHDLDEAILLGDQMLFLSRSPTRVVHSLEISLPYPREPKLLTTPAFNEYRVKSLQLFKVCVEGQPTPTIRRENSEMLISPTN